MDLLDVLL